MARAELVAALEARLLALIPEGAPTDIYKLCESLYKLARIDEDGNDRDLCVSFSKEVDGCNE